MVVGVLTSPTRKAVPFGTITCSATAKLESLSARLTRELPLESNPAPVSTRTCIVWPLWSQRDNQRTPWTVLGGFWVNREAAVGIRSRHAPRSRSRSRDRIQRHCVGPIGGRFTVDNASTRSVGCEGLALTAPAVETDVLPGTPNMFPTAVLGTSASKRVWVVSTEPLGSCGVPSIS